MAVRPSHEPQSRTQQPLRPGTGRDRPPAGHGVGYDAEEDVRIAVVGAGSWGTTMASMLAEQLDTTLWALEPHVAEAITCRHQNPTYLAGFALSPTLRATSVYEEALQGRQLVVMAVPAQYVKGVAEAIAPFVDPQAVALSLTKGIEQRTLHRPTEILADAFGPEHHGSIGVLSGPNLAREVMARQPAATVVAASDDITVRWLQGLLNRAHFRVYRSTDVIGCEIGGAVKNVIAIASGVAEGLGYGWNSRAALITRGLAEVARLGVALGGDPMTFLGLAGNGDLIATCSSPQSRNHRVGVALGRGRVLDDVLAETNMVVEGVDSAPAVLALSHKIGVDMPIVEQVADLLRGGQSPEAAVTALMGRRPTSELHDLSGTDHQHTGEGG